MGLYQSCEYIQQFSRSLHVRLVGCTRGEISTVQRTFCQDFRVFRFRRSHFLFARPLPATMNLFRRPRTMAAVTMLPSKMVKMQQSTVLILVAVSVFWFRMMAKQAQPFSLLGVLPSVSLPAEMYLLPGSTKSHCNETITSSLETTSLTDSDYPQYKSLSQLLEGPGLTALDLDEAVCEFRRVRYWFHFPHT